MAQLNHLTQNKTKQNKKKHTQTHTKNTFIVIVIQVIQFHEIKLNPIRKQAQAQIYTANWLLVEFSFLNLA